MQFTYTGCNVLEIYPVYIGYPEEDEFYSEKLTEHFQTFVKLISTQCELLANSAKLMRQLQEGNDNKDLVIKNQKFLIEKMREETQNIISRLEEVREE